MSDDSMALGYALGQDSNNNGGGNDGMWGGNGSWIFAFLIIALIFGGNGWGFGGNNGAGYQGAVTRSDLCSEFNFNNLSRSVLGIQNGLCDGFYSTNNGMLTGFNTLGNNVSNGFHGVDNEDFYADMAKSFWLCDKDAVEDKLAAYYENVVRHN